MKINTLNDLIHNGWRRSGRYVYRSSGEQVVVSIRQSNPCMDNPCYCSTGFGWGRYKGPETIHLASLMLAIEYGPYPEEYPVSSLEFRDELIAGLPNFKNWQITSHNVHWTCRIILKHREIKMFNEVENRKISTIMRLAAKGK